MPRSSRHKSRRQSKHRDYSDSEEDSKKVSKQRNGKEETLVRASRDSVSGSVEKRKSSSLYSQSRKDKDLYSHDSGDDFVVSKRRKDKGEVVGSDRWNGGGDDRSVVVDKEVKGESFPIVLEKSKHLIELKSKPSKRSDANEKKEDLAGLLIRKEESKNAKTELRRKTEKDKSEKERSERESSRKESSQHKDSKEKDRGLERNAKVLERNKRELETRAEDSEGKRKQGSHISLVNDEHKVKRGSEHTERPVHEKLQNHEIEKEVEKQSMRKVDFSLEKDKYKDEKNISDDKLVLSKYKDERHAARSYKDERDTDGSYKDSKYKDGRHIDGSYKDEKNTDGSYKDRYRDDMDRERRHRDGKQKEDIDKEKRSRAEKYRDERVSRDHPIEKYDLKNRRNEADIAESCEKKPRIETSHFDGSGDRSSSKCKDDKGKIRSEYKEVANDLRARSVKEQQSYLDKKSSTGSKVEPVAERERPRSRHADMESPLSHHSRRRSSPNSGSLAAKDHYRYSKEDESKYRGEYEERDKNYVSSRDVTVGSMVHQKAPSSMDKFNAKDEDHKGSSSDRRINSDIRKPMQSPSGSTDHRPHLKSRSAVSRNLDVEEPGSRRGAPREFKDISTHESKLKQDFEHSQTDGENNKSSPFIRTSYSSGHLNSFRPPHNPTGFNSYEDGKTNNRFKRAGDPNLGRGVQGNSWNGVPNWPSPSPSHVPNRFIPFQHGPPPVGYHHPIMQQQFPVPPPMFGGGRPPMEVNHHHGVPFHGPPFGSYPSSSLQGWDASNGPIGDGSHMYWEHNNMSIGGSCGGWETGVDTWKGQNFGMITKSLSTPQLENTCNTEVKVLSEYDQKERDLQVECAVINPLGETSDQGSLEASKKVLEKTAEISKKSKDDDNARVTRYYLSKLDISGDLISPEFCNQCAYLIGEKDAIVDVVVEEVIEAKVMISSNDSNASIFIPIDDSTFKRAMSFYKKQKVEIAAATFLPFLSNTKKVPFSHSLETSILSSTQHDQVAAIVPPKEVYTETPTEEPKVKSENTFMDIDTGLDDCVSKIKKEEEKLVEANYVSSEAAVMPELSDFESVNLNRIHHLPQSTH